MRRIINAFVNSREGVKAAFKSEAAFRQLVIIHLSLLILLIFCPFEIVTKMILVFVSLFSIIVELLNTGLEKAVDHTSLEMHPLAKIAKDVGSAAQFFALLLTFLMWSMALYSYFV